MKWIATFGWINQNTGRPEYRAAHFEADDITAAHNHAMSLIKDRDEYLYEIRARKVQD